MGFWSSSYNNRDSIKCLNDYFLGTCGSCSLLNGYEAENRYGNGKAYCSHVSYGHRLDETARGCRKYDGPVDPNKRDYTKLFYNLKGREYRGYYILTAICKVLGISLESDFYNEIKTLIQLVRADGSTQKEAIGYDTFGEKIAEDLMKDGNSFEICKVLLTTYLTKVYLLIKQNNQEEAIEVYKQMVTFLYSRYKNIDNQETLIDSYSLNESLNKRLVK